MATDEKRLMLEVASDWQLAARPKQLAPPGAWDVWLVQTGRGWGKTRTAAEYVRSRIERGEWRRVTLVGPTAADLRDTMVEGPSGLLNVFPPHRRPLYEPSKRRITYEPTGAVITCVPAVEPDRLRGFNADGAWGDEIDSWESPEAWDMLRLGVRTGPDPRIVATSTPKRSRLVARLSSQPNVVVTRGSTYENEANLARAFLDTIRERYEGTHLGRQEIHGELLEEIEGALVSPGLIAQHRVIEAPELRRVAVGVDPSGSAERDRQGIVVAGVGGDGDGYVLADRSCSLRPEGWGRRVVEAALEFEADVICVEVNYGGDMAESVIQQAARAMGAHVRIRKVHATRAKHVRFEPVALLYEQGRLHHVGTHDRLEDQVTAFTGHGYEGDESPDRADALVWAVTELMLARRGLSPADLYGGADAVPA